MSDAQPGADVWGFGDFGILSIDGCTVVVEVSSGLHLYDVVTRRFVSGEGAEVLCRWSPPVGFMETWVATFSKRMFSQTVIEVLLRELPGDFLRLRALMAWLAPDEKLPEMLKRRRRLLPVLTVLENVFNAVFADLEGFEVTFAQYRGLFVPNPDVRVILHTLMFGYPPD